MHLVKKSLAFKGLQTQESGVFHVVVFLGLGSEVSEFLEGLDEETRRVYKYGLKGFGEFYAACGSIGDFLDRVEEDTRRPRMVRKRVARKVLRMFVDWLQLRGYKPKTVRAYVGAVQALCRYYDLNVSTRFIRLPQNRPASRKKAWTIDEIANFIDMMDKPIYRAIATIAFQSGLGLGDILALKYGDIKEEYEKGVTPLCLDLSRIKTDVAHLTFIGKWALSMLRQHLKGKRLKSQDRLFKITARAVDSYFQRLAKKFVGNYEDFNPCRIHSLRAAFRTLLSDHQVDPLYLEF
jgi:integrase